MNKPRTISLESIRTDGWFERLGESISSFHTLCDVLGEHFFAFALIAGARVSSLMIDRFNPDQSLVEFSLGGVEGAPEEPAERLTVAEFRQRLVATLLTKEPIGPRADELGDDLEAVQKHVGPRSLLLAPLYGYGLRELVIDGVASTLRVERAGATESFEVQDFRACLIDHVKDDLERGVERQSGSTAIDLNNVDEAEAAGAEGNWEKVAQLLASWPMPLAIYWRTPEGQMLPEAARQRIADGLGLLGTAFANLGDSSQGEEVLRLAVQYAQDGSSAGAIFARLGRMFIAGERWGEAIGPLRRAQSLGSDDPPSVLADLARAFLGRNLALAALACCLDAEEQGFRNDSLDELRRRASDVLGDDLTAWSQLVG